MTKRFICMLLVLSFSRGVSQNPCATAKAGSFSKSPATRLAKPTNQLNSFDGDYDVKFYHLNLNAENDTTFLSGDVRCLAKVTIASMDTFTCLLHTAHTVDSVYINGTKRYFVRQDSLVKTGVGNAIMQNQMVDATVYYHGTCPAVSNPIYNNGFYAMALSSGDKVSRSASESFVAYEWWPCKQDLKDKIDSSWVFVTTDSTNKVGSNGRLKHVVTVGNKKRYEWKSSHPIDYYLVSVAIGKFIEYDFYAKPLYLLNDSILIQNFVPPSQFNDPIWIMQNKQNLDMIKPCMELFCTLYGMYPFWQEKYGHCFVPQYGGMENQTMTSTNAAGYFELPHELAHQWWGDYVTCKAWKDIWINEGWASYNEYIFAQNLGTQSADGHMLGAHSSVMQQPGGSCYFTDADTMNSGIIFDSRLTYDKGGAIIHSIRFELNNDSVFFQTCRGFLTAHSYNVASVQDFIAYFNANSGKNFTQFFNQWYYGEGYPTFDVKWNQVGGNFYLRSTQSTSMPSSVPLFITPLEYKIQRASMADTIIRVQHGQTVENYFFSLQGTVTNVTVDPKNWIINKAIGPVKDQTLTGIDEAAQPATAIFVGPNPTSDVLNIQLYNSDKAIAEIYDINGRLMKQFAFEGSLQSDISAFASGIYTVSVKKASGEPLRTVKIVKE